MVMEFKERRVRRPITAYILATIYGWLGWDVEIAYVLQVDGLDFLSPIDVSGSHIAVRCSKEK